MIFLDVIAEQKEVKFSFKNFFSRSKQICLHLLDKT